MSSRWGAALVAAVGLWAGPARAQDDGVMTLRLGDVPAVQPNYDGPEDDTQLVHRRFYGGYRGFYGGGFKGFYGGYRPAFYGGFGGYKSFYGHKSYYGGFNGFGYNSFYRPAFYGGFGGYRSFYTGFYPRYYSPRFAFSLSLGYRPYYSPSYYYPIGLSPSYNGSYAIPALPPGIVPPQNGLPYNGGPYIGPPLNGPPAKTPMPPADAPPDGTFPYDGGPSDPVPVPKTEPSRELPPPRKAVPEGRIVSLPAPRTKFAYPAYGEAPPSTFAQDRPDPVRTVKR